jgi:HAD superfamily hydrolase (TIGR01549 family)
MAKAKRLAIFDLDNTLIITTTASKDAYKHAINLMAKYHGIYHLRHKLYNHWKRIVQKVKQEKNPALREFHYSLSLLLQAHKIPDTYLSQALAAFEKELLENIALQRGVKEVLSWLQKAEVTIAVATESTKGLAKKKIKAADLKKYVSILVTASDIGIMKPSADYYLQAIKLAQTNPQNTIVIGDSQINDIDPAHSLGISAVLVPPSSFHLGVVKTKIEDWLKSAK